MRIIVKILVIMSILIGINVGTEVKAEWCREITKDSVEGPTPGTYVVVKISESAWTMCSPLRLVAVYPEGIDLNTTLFDSVGGKGGGGGSSGKPNSSKPISSTKSSPDKSAKKRKKSPDQLLNKIIKAETEVSKGKTLRFGATEMSNCRAELTAGLLMNGELRLTAKPRTGGGIFSDNVQITLFASDGKLGSVIFDAKITVDKNSNRSHEITVFSQAYDTITGDFTADSATIDWIKAKLGETIAQTARDCMKLTSEIGAGHEDPTEPPSP